MHIVVTVKQVPDTGVPPEIDPDRPTSVRGEGVVHILNPADRSALETAVRLKERHGGEVTAVTVGPACAERALRVALAGGADRAVRLWDEAFAGSDAQVTAFILAHCVAPLRPDLVLSGKRALDGYSGLVPPALAETLGLPFVAGVTAVEVVEDGGMVKVQRALERGNREVLRCRLPAVLAVEAGISEPRYAALPDLVAALQAPIETLDLARLGLARRRVGQMGSLTRVIALSSPRPRPKKAFTPDSSLPAEERLRLLLSGGVGNKQGDLLEGQPDAVAAQVVRFLRNERLL